MRSFLTLNSSTYLPHTQRHKHRTDVETDIQLDMDTAAETDIQTLTRDRKSHARPGTTHRPQRRQWMSAATLPAPTCVYGGQEKVSLCQHRSRTHFTQSHTP